VCMSQYLSEGEASVLYDFSLIPESDIYIFLYTTAIRTALWPANLSMVEGDWNMKLTAYLHLMPVSRMLNHS
jgi:hypothetical protein